MCGPSESERGFIAAYVAPLDRADQIRREREEEDAKKKHLSDIEFLNQNVMGK